MFHATIVIGVWICDYDNRNETRWQLMECKAPEDLQFAGSSVRALQFILPACK